MNWYIYCANDPVNAWDPSGLIITLNGSDEDLTKSYEEISALTDDKISINDNGQLYISEEVNGGSKPTGTGLVRSLIQKSDFNVSIQRNGSHFNPATGVYEKYSTEIISANSEGVGINISDEYNNSNSIFNLVEGALGEVTIKSMANTPSQITMGHELIHAYDYMVDGILNNMGGGSHGYSIGNHQYTETMTNSFGNKELDAIGIDYYDLRLDPKTNVYSMQLVPASQNQFTENKIRAEQGEGKKLRYTQFVLIGGL